MEENKNEEIKEEKTAEEPKEHKKEHKKDKKLEELQNEVNTLKDKNMRIAPTFPPLAELEQAIGRARLLRENCTVYVFSNYPCQQAELVQEKYLKDNMETLDCVESGSDTLEC